MPIQDQNSKPIEERGRAELRRDLRRELGFKPVGGRLRVAELRRALRRLKATHSDAHNQPGTIQVRDQ